MSEIRIKLDRLERLFTELPFDLAQPEFTRSVIEAVIRSLRSSRLSSGPIKLVVQLTLQTVTAELKSSGEIALHEFCRQKIEENRQTALNIRRAGWLALRVGILVLALALVLSATFNHFQALLVAFNRLFSEGFLIVGWVMLWLRLKHCCMIGLCHIGRCVFMNGLARRNCRLSAEKLNRQPLNQQTCCCTRIEDLIFNGCPLPK